jgi:hypothetical protein
MTVFHPFKPSTVPTDKSDSSDVISRHMPHVGNRQDLAWGPNDADLLAWPPWLAIERLKGGARHVTGSGAGKHPLTVTHHLALWEESFATPGEHGPIDDPRFQGETYEGGDGAPALGLFTDLIMGGPGGKHAPVGTKRQVLVVPAEHGPVDPVQIDLRAGAICEAASFVQFAGIEADHPAAEGAKVGAKRAAGPAKGAKVL